MGVRITYPKIQYDAFKYNAVQKYNTIKEEYADKIHTAKKRVDFYDNMGFIGCIITACAIIMCVGALITKSAVDDTNKTTWTIAFIIAGITAVIAFVIAVKATYTKERADEKYDSLKETIGKVLIQSGFDKEIYTYYGFIHFTDNISEDDILSHICTSKNVELASTLHNACTELKKKTDSIALSKVICTNSLDCDVMSVQIRLNGHAYDTYTFDINNIDAFLCVTKNDDIDLSFIDNDASHFID